MKYFTITCRGQILAGMPASNSAEALEKFRAQRAKEAAYSIKRAEETLEFVKSQRQWEADHPLELQAEEAP